MKMNNIIMGKQISWGVEQYVALLFIHAFPNVNKQENANSEIFQLIKIKAQDFGVQIRQPQTIMSNFELYGWKSRIRLHKNTWAPFTLLSSWWFLNILHFYYTCISIKLYILEFFHFWTFGSLKFCTFWFGFSVPQSATLDHRFLWGMSLLVFLITLNLFES